MRNLDVLKRRLEAMGGSAEDRLLNDKLKTLKKALTLSYQSEEIVLNNTSMRALINDNKLKMDYDDKMISIPYDSQIKVGDIFFWKRVNCNWIVYLQQYAEDAYFRGYARKADHTISWKDEFGSVHEIYAAIRGPVETKTRSQLKSGMSFDEPNYTLNAIIPNNQNTIELKRYSRVTIDNKPWSITTIDSISEKGVIEINLVEDYLNRDEDTKELVGGKIKTDIQITCCFDDIEKIQINTPVSLWVKVYVDGVQSIELQNEAFFIVSEGFGNIANGQFETNSNTHSTIILTIPSIRMKKTFVVEGVENIESNVLDVEIVGDSKVKSYGVSTYKALKYVNGIEVEADGKWKIIGDNSLYTIAKISDTEISVEWTLGKKGFLTIEYTDSNGKRYQKEVKIETII